MKILGSRIAKLCGAGLVTAFICAAVLYQTQPSQLFWVYRCLDGADSPLNCYRGKHTKFRTTTFGFVYEGSTEDYIDRHVLFWGGFEKPEMFFLRDVSSGGVFLDIGANKGLYSLFMSKYQKAVHAFEPYEPVLKKFRALVALNGLQNIVIHPVGLGDKHERLEFEKPGNNNQGMGSFAFVSDSGLHERLEIMPGDQILKAAGVVEVDLIKMDIEGFERPALNGLAQTLARSRPIVLFEVTLNARGKAPFASMEQIAKAFPSGYKFRVLHGLDPYTGAYELLSTEGRLNFGGGLEQHNLVAFPSEKESRIPVRSR